MEIFTRVTEFRGLYKVFNRKLKVENSRVNSEISKFNTSPKIFEIYWNYDEKIWTFHFLMMCENVKWFDELSDFSILDHKYKN